MEAPRPPPGRIVQFQLPDGTYFEMFEVDSLDDIIDY